MSVWLVNDYLTSRKDWYISDEWARKIEEEGMSYLLKLEHRRRGEGEKAFNSAVAEIRRMIKNNNEDEVKIHFEIVLTITDPTQEQPDDPHPAS